jgi:4-alpha-glucanotransferase
MNLFPRSSGILLHPTCLPGHYGIGDLGSWAYRFVDWLASAGQTIWQVLPLGPTGQGDSPYQTLSAFAGNPNLISLDKLTEDGWLLEEDLAAAPNFPDDRVDFGAIGNYHDQRLTLAYKRFKADATVDQKAQFRHWCAENRHWLDDYVVFKSLKDHYGGAPWVGWPQALALRARSALEQARHEHLERINDHRFQQWMFFRQWSELKAYANRKGIRLIGDIPIFVAHDSADVWAQRENFHLDKNGNPTVVAGVPPDYFSKTGQRWGNPIYRWERMATSGYQWWIRRFQTCLALVDIVRIDHFRGFEAYWEIRAEEQTAVNGKWIPGVGADFFNVLRATLDKLPIIAEDLGLITPQVERLRDDFELPGMKVLQFAWSDPKNPFLPHQHGPNCVVYSGTHDNNTTLGWWSTELNEDARRFMSDYVGQEVYEPNWTLIRLGMMSVAHTFIAPLQDILGLGPEARMNTPSTESGNWIWRFTPEAFTHPGRERLAHLTRLYRRHPDQQREDKAS